MSRLTIAIPSKGRLKEQTEGWLARIGHPVRQIGGERGYTAEIDGLDAEVRLLSAREIAQGLIEGSLHFGVTGEDLLNDLAPDPAEDFRVLKRLGFGAADVVVAVPQAWFDVDTMADLEAAGAAFRKAHGRRLRVATKYLRLTRRYFAQKSVGEYRLVESAGATEAAPATGTADVIVDITTTGATLKANGLKILRDGLVLKSEAAFASSARAKFGPSAASARAVLTSALSQGDHDF
ncbi:MAG: ATP phosphoribosyltransferase [Hyphomonas sp.]|uniref:ATP phosphoribosyltransferase n=1 Tax=Hyphomonas sp. TaxID=87 RepID=UPI0034A03592